MFSVKIYTIHSWEYISLKWTCLIEIWITWFQKELATPQFQIPHMKSQKELWKPDLYLVSQECQHEKISKLSYRIRTQDPCISCKYFYIGPAGQLHSLSTKLLMRRSQLGEQICQTSKWPTRMTVIVDFNWTNIDLWEFLLSCFGSPVTKYLMLVQIWFSCFLLGSCSSWQNLMNDFGTI
jgi:hypothetical protein